MLTTREILKRGVQTLHRTQFNVLFKTLDHPIRCITTTKHNFTGLSCLFSHTNAVNNTNTAWHPKHVQYVKHRDVARPATLEAARPATQSKREFASTSARSQQPRLESITGAFGLTGVHRPADLIRFAQEKCKLYVYSP